jgi:hypothetical protein
VTVDATTIDWAAVEADLRRRVRAETGIRAGFYRRLTGEEQFWRGDQALAMSAVESEDEPAECQRVAVRAAQKHGLQIVCCYFTAGKVAPPVWHCANRLPATGELVDAARSRRPAIAYVGKVLEPHEVALLARSASTPTPGEMARAFGERWSETGRSLGSVFDSLFG